MILYVGTLVQLVAHSTEEALLQKSKSMTLYAIECNPRTTNGLDILSLKHEKVIWQAYMRFLGEIPFNEKNAKGSTTNEKLYVKNNNYYIRLRTTVPSIMAIMKVGGLQDTVDSLKASVF